MCVIESDMSVVFKIRGFYKFAQQWGCAAGGVKSEGDCWKPPPTSFYGFSILNFPDKLQ